ncbi:hypothetical protein ACJ72_01674 [Emergomyces africanus]|uniref:Zn(2)-C6 fungal-type domain-containing protein n=1 Tax=Emergomyces africanus TaxID=1955775 RepID=A0A1B7P4M0_9EURO|nr:hypothetical protein ACJ72_01674 [Emergomyces africanus]
MDRQTRRGSSKRKRVSKACNRCRSRKYRCDGLHPACLACQESGHGCSYDPILKKRGLPEGYVRGLEKLWALSIANIEGLEEVVLELLGSKEKASSRRSKLLSLWNNEAASEKLHETWKSSGLYANVEELLASPGPAANGPSCIEGKGGGSEPEDSAFDISSDSQPGDFSHYRVREFMPWALTRIPHASPLPSGAGLKGINLSGTSLDTGRLMEGMKHNTSTAWPPDSQILNIGSSRRDTASLYLQHSSPSESTYDILNHLEYFLQEDMDIQKQIYEEDLSCFLFLPRTSNAQAGDFYCTGSREEPSIPTSAQDAGGDCADLQPPSPSIWQNSLVTTSLSRAQGDGSTSPLPQCNSRSPAPLPAFNDIEFIFHNLPTPTPTPTTSSTSNSASQTHEASTAHFQHHHDDENSFTYDTYAQLIIDLCDDASFEDALFNNHDDDDDDDNANFRADGAHGPQRQRGQKEKREGKEKRERLSVKMHPPSIADIWPPPGFFPHAFRDEGLGANEVGGKYDS